MTRLFVLTPRREAAKENSNHADTLQLVMQQNVFDYPNGITSFSPRLAAQRATLGYGANGFQP